MVDMRSGGNVRAVFVAAVLALTAVVGVSPSGAETGDLNSPPVSDDFNECTLESALWTLVDPAGDASATANGTQLELSIPGGSAHDLWRSPDAPMLVQPINDTDFQLEMKLDSALTTRFQMQGMVVRQDVDDLLRFDFYTTGSRTYLFASVMAGGSSTRMHQIRVTPSGSSMWMRVTRTGDTWTQSFSFDGTNWTDAPSFTYAMTAVDAGPFVGNAGSNPAHTALVDYFFNTASPISPEDDVTQDCGGGDPGGDDPTLTVTTQGSGSVTISPDQPSYEVGDVVTLTAVPNTGNDFVGWQGDISGTTNPVNVTMTEDQTITALFSPSGPTGSGPVIDVWYDTTLPFGQVGRPQRWVNVLGNVVEPGDTFGIAQLSYTLNGGSSRPLAWGGDRRRLDELGDFNIDIDADELVNGANTVVITAIDNDGEVDTETVTINWSAGNSWPTNYSIDWSSATSIQDVAQVVDGKWQIEGDGVRIIQPGYDRLMAIGERTWTDYEVTVPFTVNALDLAGFNSALSGRSASIGILTRWTGHTEDPVANYQPESGWRPYGAIGWYWWDDPNVGELRILGNGDRVLASDPGFSAPQVGQEHMIKMRVETNANGTATHRLKMWPSASPEPSNWLLNAVTNSGQPQSGSFLLLAHHVDATFGDVSVTELSGAGQTTTLTVNTQGNGSVGASPAKATYATTDVVTLTATPDAGYQFTGWQGDLSGSANPETLTMSTNRTVTAVFDPIATNGPAISNVQVATTETSATVTWNTDVPATSEVAYGTTAAYELGTETDGALKTSHSITLNGLSSETTYHYQITSVDGSSDSSSTGDATFTTDGPPGTPTLISDDFNACFFNPSTWSLIDPDGHGFATISSGVAFEASLADATFDQTHAAEPGDFDGDGDLDLVATDYGQGAVEWLRNDGGSYTRIMLDPALAGAYPVSTGDLDGDGDDDVVAGGYIADQLVWYTNNGSGGFTRVDIDTAANGIHSMVLVDLDEDGDTDLVTTNQDGDEVAWYENDGSENFTKRLIDGSADAAKRAEAADIDGDGDLDVVSASANDDTVAWFENDGSENFTKRVVDSGIDGAYYVTLDDMDGDGDVDIVAAARNGNEVVLLTNDGSENFSRSAIDASADGARTAISVDLDGDGDNDIVRSAADSDSIVWLDNLGSGNFAKRYIDPNAQGGYGVAVADMDNDGNLDVIAANRDSDSVIVHRQVASGTAHQQLELSVTGEGVHDLWTNRDAPILVQSVPDEDFEVELKFDSIPDLKIQMQGLAVRQDANNLLRFDFHTNGNRLYAFAGKIVGGSPSSQARHTLSPTGDSLYLRVARSGDTWSGHYSYDGQNWTMLATFNQAMTVNQVGPFVGNAHVSPAHTAVIDYLFDTAAPVSPEDGNNPTCS